MEVKGFWKDAATTLGQKEVTITITINNELCRLKMEILVEDKIPVYKNPRRMSAHERNIAQEMIAQFISEA